MVKKMTIRALTLGQPNSGFGLEESKFYCYANKLVMENTVWHINCMYIIISNN